MRNKQGAKSCSTGANCKSTCIAKSKDCLKEKSNEQVKQSVLKLKGKKPSRDKEDIAKELKIFKLKRGSVEAAEVYLKNRMTEGNSHKSKIHALEVPISGGSEAQQKVLRNEVYKYTLTTGHYPEITALKIVPNRSSVDINKGDIEIKASNNADHLAKSLWHEMAHMLELDPKLKDAAVKFRESNSEGSLKLMSELTGNLGYKDNEEGYSSKVWESQPYIGKVNVTGNTEIFSMSIENLRSPVALAKAYESIPKVMDFAMGMI
jgi:hypothetical protein